MLDAQSLYDDIIAGSYDTDRFRLLSRSRDIALDQLRRHLTDSPPADVLDLALGTGEILVELQGLFPGARLSGIDISRRMIDIAQQKLELNAIHDDLANVSSHIEPDSHDLALLHFVLSYVDTDKALADTARLLRDGGLCSIATSTFDSFKVLQGLAHLVMPADEMKRLADLPENPAELAALLEAAGFDVVERHVLTEKVRFEDFAELNDWGTNSGWLTQYFTRITDEQARMLSAVGGVFPLEDEFQGAIMLLRKRSQAA